MFVNDPATLSRHAQARYLPVCYDERVHTGGGEPRRYAVGFIGGANARRERVLDALARHRLLSYVVGGPWRSRRLAAMSLGGNVPPARTAELYRATQVVVNAFRDGHHFNRDRIAATSMNPRIYEALACGALVVSERRPEIDALLPDLPTFESESDVVPLVAGLLDRPDEIAARHAACADRIRGATYSARLGTVMDVIFNARPTQEVNVESIAGPSTATDGEAASARTAAGEPPSAAEPTPPPSLGGTWAPHGAFTIESLPESLNIAKAWDGTPGSERGFVTNGSYTSVDLSFELSLGPESCFLAKLLQADRLDQGSNSYHLLFDGHVTYLARHNRIFKTWPAFDENWRRVRFTYAHGVVSVAFDDRPPFRVQDGLLRQGYGFLGLKGGAARLRNAHISSLVGLAPPSASETAHRVMRQSGRTTPPTVSILTTVYDRPECLRQCMRTVKRLSFRDYEHIIAADGPPPEILDAIAQVVTDEGDDQVQLLTLQRRRNDWGIAPAAAALGRATGQFVCFLSDDNGYLPDHLNQLVAELERDPALGFVYSSCLYGGLTTLRHPTPRPARIDLGQPLFRRELFERYLGNGLPFNMMAWDWYMIDALLKRGVRWKHVDQATFVFRLLQYPQLMVPR